MEARIRVYYYRCRLSFTPRTWAFNSHAILGEMFSWANTHTHTRGHTRARAHNGREETVTKTSTNAGTQPASRGTYLETINYCWSATAPAALPALVHGQGPTGEYALSVLNCSSEALELPKSLRHAYPMVNSSNLSMSITPT